jgi:hypothetical protein
VVAANRELAKSKSSGLSLLAMKLPAVPIQQAYAGKGEKFFSAQKGDQAK